MMTVNEQLLGLIAMAVAVVAILTVGTLVAADIIRLGSRRSTGGPDAGTEPARHRRIDLHTTGTAGSSGGREGGWTT